MFFTHLALSLQRETDIRIYNVLCHGVWRRGKEETDN